MCKWKFIKKAACFSDFNEKILEAGFSRFFFNISMMTYSLRNAFVYILFFSFLGCNPVKTIYIDQELPPLRNFPNSVKKIGFLNRVSRDKTPLVHLDSDFLYFGEARDGSNSALNTVYNRIEKMGGYELLLFQTDMPIVGIEEMPIALTSTEVSQICDNLGIDVLISMEYFSANFEKDIQESTVEGYDQMSNAATTFFVATMNARIDAAFRVYLPGEKELFDEYKLGENLSFKSQENSKKAAKSNLISKRDAVINWGNAFAKNYAARFAPRTFKTIRHVCKGKDKRFKDAHKYAKKNEWNEAEILWKSLVDSDDAENRAYALFNLALIAELDNDLLTASDLLKQAISTYEFAEASRYLRIIKTKIEVNSH